MDVKIMIRRMTLRNPFGISRGTRKSVRNVFLRIGEGLGEGAPVYYLGQTPEEMQTLLRSWLDRNRPAADAPVRESVEAFLADHPGQTGAAQALDLALCDAASKRAGQTLREWLGVPIPGLPMISSFTIGLDGAETVRRKVAEAADHPILKVKTGGGDDEALLRLVSEASGGKPLYIDANEGWTADEAIRFLPLLREANCRLLEQPLPGRDREGYAKLREANQTGIPVMIDEGIQSPGDAAPWSGLADGINIKLAKCGGVTRALALIEEARANGLKVMLGCMIESSLGITAAANLAPLADFLDLDGAALLADDPFRGALFEKGSIIPPGEPGIGAAPLDDRI